MLHFLTSQRLKNATDYRSTRNCFNVLIAKTPFSICSDIFHLQQHDLQLEIYLSKTAKKLKLPIIYLKGRMI